MFRKILHANDGSEHAFNALSLALQIAKHDTAELHMVSVEQIDHMPELVEEARQDTGTAPSSRLTCSSWAPVGTRHCMIA